MSTLTITSKGQVTLKKDVLQHLGVAPGARVVVDMLPDGTLQMKAEPKGDISQVFGLLKTGSKRTLSIEDMSRIISSGWAGKP